MSPLLTTRAYPKSARETVARHEEAPYPGRMRPLLGFLLAPSVLVFPATTLAQDAASGGALFDRGVAEMEAGRFDTGCPALAESHRVDPRPGTLFTLAECESSWGKVASAVAHYEDYMALVTRLPSDQQARHRERVETARTTVARLKPTVPTLAVSLPSSAPDGTTVTRGRVVLQGASLGLALPVDPGEHVIVTRVPGRPDHEQKVSVALGEAKRIQTELPPAAAPPATAPEPPAPTEAGPTGGGVPTVETRSSGGASRRAWGWTAGGVGAAGLVVGAVTGILVLGKKGTVSDECDGAACSKEGLEAASSGKRLATVSTVGFGVGLAGLGVGAFLLLTGSPSSTEDAIAERVQPLFAAGYRSAWAGVSGRF